LPAVGASKTPKAVTLPQLAAGTGKTMASFLEVMPLLPVLMVVLPAAWVPAQAASAAPTAARA
jgi:hypothetical protein